MKIYIARHYWKDGQNATWECHNKVDKVVFEYLKENYHKFVANKPEMIEQNNHYVYLCYEEGKDTYDRNITNITFFISKKRVEINLCQRPYSDLELEIKSSSRKSLLFKGLWVVIGLIVIYMVLSDNEPHNDKIIDDNASNIEQHDKDKKTVPSIQPRIDKQLSLKELEKKKKDTFNKEVSDFIENIDKEINSYEDFLHLEKSVKSLIKKQSNALISTQNKREIKILKELFDQYKDVLTSGINVKVKIAIPKKDRRKYELSKIAFNEQYCKEQKDKFWSCNIKNGDDIHIVLKQKGIHGDSPKVLEKDFIDEDFLIGVYNGTINKNSKLKKIRDGYSLQIEKKEER